MRDRLIKALARASRAAQQPSGFAVPTALMLTLAAMAIVSVGVVTSIRVQKGAVRDQETKSALAVAEAGVSHAMLHFNRIPPNELNACSPVTSSPPSNGWCPAVTGSLNGGTFTYQVRPLTLTSGGNVTERTIEVVSTGTLDGVNRRVYVKGNSASGTQVFFQSTVLARENVHMDSNAYVNANMSTNGNVTMDANSQLCGHLHYGVGKSYTLASNAAQVCGTNSQANLSIPSVNQGDILTNNDNSRLFSQDRISGNKQDACWNGTKGNGQPGTCGPRELNINNNSSVTLAGTRYSFCKLHLDSNTALFIQAGAVVTIYFDTPENCGLDPGENQLELFSNARITSNSTTGGAANVAMLFVGSTTTPSSILLNSNTSIGTSCQQNFVIYAPRHDVTLNSNSTFCGAIGSKSLELDANSQIFTDADSSDYILPNTPPHYELGDFIECGTTPGSPPNTGC
jgi:type II secretory pathway pseudopilin PulG